MNGKVNDSIKYGIMNACDIMCLKKGIKDCLLNISLSSRMRAPVCVRACVRACVRVLSNR